VFRLPHQAWALCDVRVPRGYSAARVAEKIRQHLDRCGFSDIEMNILDVHEPYGTDENSALVRAVMQLLDEDGIPVQVWPYSAGAGPWSMFAQMGMPVLFDVGIGHGGNAGGTDEFLAIDGNGRVAGWVEAQLFYLRLLYRWAELQVSESPASPVG